MKERLLTAIDIGTSKIATLIAKLSENDREPRVMGFASVASRGVKRGQIIDIHQVTTAIEEAVERAERMAGVKVSETLVTVGGPHIASLNSHGVVAVMHPEVEISQEDVARAIDAAQAISLSSTREIIEVVPKEYIVDGQGSIKNPVGMTGVRLEVTTHIITAGVTNLRNIERCLSDLDITVVQYVFSGLSSAEATISETEKELGVVLVDIGGGKTDICIFIEGALAHSVSVPIGARHITNDIAVGLRISLDSAEIIKLFLLNKAKENERGAGNLRIVSKKDDIDIRELMLPEGLLSISYKTVAEGIIRPRMEEIFEKILDEIEKSGYITMVPSGLVIVGGGACTLGVVQTAKKVIGLACRVGQPSGVTGLVDEVLYPSYASVVGLVRYAASTTQQSKKGNLRDFSRFLTSFSPQKSLKKITDLIKSFIP